MGLFGDMISKLKGSGPSEPKSGVTATPSDEVIGKGKYKVVRVQPTPNPEAFQFTVTSPVIEEGRTKTFDSADDAEGNPFAEKMFQIFGVQTLFMKGDFVTITKSPTVGWPAIMEKINAVLEGHLTFQESYDEHKEAKSDPLLEEFKKEEFHNYEVAEQNRIIEAVLDKAIRPALANDGGGIQVIAIEGNTVKIHYQGACGSCPSSTSGTLQYIENFLRDNVHSELVVEAG